MKQRINQISHNRKYHKILSVVLALCLVLTLSGMSTMVMPADTVFAGNSSLAEGAAVDLATLSTGASLPSGTYYLSEDKTFGSASSGTNGLKIASNATVYIYIPAGVTLTAIGGGTNTARTTGGYAGILLPSSSKLILLGEGTVIATGGRAGNGANGSSGNSGYLDVGTKYYGGSGGSGGSGGGGAGAGIGTNGGTGGSGGSGASSSNTITSGSSNCDANNGSAGGSGKAASSCGTLYKQSTITLTATGGTYGGRGSGGSAGSCRYSSSKWGGKKYHVAGGGGGGGGGGAGYFAYGVGTGGAGGGGGGGGGGGATDYTDDNSYDGPTTNASCNGAGGSGGTGANNGYTGYGTRDSGSHDGSWKKEGGYGASGGSAGSGSSAKSVQTGGWTDKSFTVVFAGEETTIQSDTYVFGTAHTVTVPEYTPATDKCFLGWTVSRYGTSPAEGVALTETDTRQYQPGDVISLDAGFSGEIVFVPALVGEADIPEESGRVWFHANGGNGGPTVSVFTADRQLPASVTTPSKEGYDFTGYYSAMLNGTKYYDAAGRRVYGTALEQSVMNVNAYAQWAVHSSELYINPNGGTYGGSDETVFLGNYKYGVTVRIADPVPANNETVFKGWAMNGDNGSLIRGAGYTTFVCGPDTTAVTLKAIWNAGNKVQPTEDNTGKNINVSGLESLYEPDNTVSSENSSNGITVEEYAEDVTTVRTVIENTTEDEKIVSLLEDSSSVALEYYDISVIKTTNGTETKLTELPELITIEIPLTGELEGKTGYSVFRVHNGLAEQMSSSPTAKEYYEIVYADGVAQKVVIHTQKFSTYAVTASSAVIGAVTELTEENNHAATDVQGKYTDGSSVAVYKIDIEWGNMNFDFHKHKKWNPENHSYGDELQVVLDEDTAYLATNNEIVVTNHSNADVRINAVISESKYDGIAMRLTEENNAEAVALTGSFDLDKVAYDGDPLADQKSIFLRLDGSVLSEETLEQMSQNAGYEQIGMITLTVTPLDGERTPINYS